MTGMGQDLFQRFQSLACRHPDAVAVRCGAESRSYGELYRMAASIAENLPPAGPERPSLIALHLEVGIQAVASILAVWGRGHGYLGLEPTQSAGEVAAALHQCQPCRVITSRSGGQAIPAPFDQRALVIEELEGGTAGGGDPWGGRRHPFLGVFLTSGSTGEPKGIVQTHGVIEADLERAIRDTGVGRADRIDQRFSLSFSAFLSPLMGALGTGGELHLMPAACRSSAEQARWMIDSGITYSTLTPRMWRHLCRGLEPGARFESLRFLGLSGDQFHPEDIALLRARLPADAIVQNAVASTEARTYLQGFCRAEDVDEEALLKTRPVPEKGVRILLETDGAGEGQSEGEVALTTPLRSPGLWPGYLEEGAGFADASEFPTGDWAAPAGDGDFRFLGRRSDFVKIHGYRVSLKRTETWLVRQPEVVEASVQALPGRLRGEAVLVAFCLLSSDTEETRADLKRRARAELEVHQQPQTWRYPADFPRTHTGKTDRLRLAADYGEGPLTESRGDPDHPLAAIWSRILGHRDFSAGTSFLEAGGDSLLAHDLVREIGKLTGRRVPLSLVFERPRFSEMGAWIDGEERPTTEILKQLKAGSGGSGLFLIPPFHGSCAAFRHLVEALPDSLTVHGLEIGLLEIEPSADPIPSLGRIVADSILRQVPAGPVRLGGYSMGGLVAWEAARLLAESGRTGVQLYLFDTYRFFTRLDEAEAAWMARRRKTRRRIMDLMGLLLRPGTNRRRDLWQDFVVRRFKRKSQAAEETRMELERINQQLGTGYPVPALAVQVTLIRATRQGLIVNASAPDLGWSRCCRGPLAIHQVHCTHQDLLLPGNASTVARILHPEPV